ncbi:hypothetical protein LSH36_2356g00000 [Paralvinella palmiformis]|uniref:THAP-type domain-containing protein n=1 Tax=Paralvinella palmiformis TaxID=53620 RepID=A0AAD9IQH7_9ANNE|nr:hypothetical protein LSH36_2356g00000 [Paralvinella palmiformis]
MAIRRVEDKKGQLWWPSATSVVCREYFKQDDYVQPTFIDKPQTTDKKLKGNAIQSQFSWSTAPSPSSEERGGRAVRRSRKRLLEDIEQEALFFWKVRTLT